MLVASLGGNYDVSVGSRAEAWCYATAKRMGHLRYLLEHAGRQIDPTCVSEMMADREREYGIIPGPLDTMPTRRATLAARKMLSRGARRESVEDALRTILGSAFVAYRVTSPGEILAWPTSLGDQPMNLQIPSVPRKLVRITSTVSIGLGAPQSVTYATVDPVSGTLAVGDHVVVDPEISGITETVTVAAATSTTFTATFNNAHTGGFLGSTSPYPLWVSNQRDSLIIITALTALDPETRRKVNELMQRMARGISTWSIVQQTSTNGAGPFVLDTSPLDATPLLAT